MIDAASGSTSYTYKPFGELATLTDAESNVTTLGYDARGNKTSMSDPNMGSWSYDYNVFGELASQTNALSQTTTLAYDQAGRPTSRSETEGTTSWTYHSSGTGSKGQVYTISGPGHSMLYQYSSTLGAPTLVRRTFDGASYDFEMSYDAYGRLDVLTYPESTSSYRFKADYDYDIYGQLVRVQDGNTSTVFYEIDESDALGRAREVSLGNGLSEFRDYDRAAGYLESIQTGSGGAVQNLSFTWDKVGNLLTRTNASISKTETFTYDALDRLATMQVSGGSTISMYYSAAGRITSRSDLESYSYSGVNAGPHAVTSVNGVNYAYDANGRMTSRGGDAITWYSYDLAKKIESGSQSTEFSYGVDRQRYKQVQKTGSTIDAMIAYLGTLMEIETRGGTTTYRHYVQARDRVVARVERVGTTNTTAYLHRDHQSSVVEVTNSSGTVIDSLAFDAWGLRRNASNWAALGSPFGGTQATERGYTGHEHLDTVGLVNMNGRIQDPTIGRFLSADPIVQAPYSSQSHNRYSYVWNNPLRYTDPGGFEADQGEWNGDEITVIASCAANVSCALWHQRTPGRLPTLDRGVPASV